MTPVRKLFIAAMLVVTGFGVALILGEPNRLTRALRENSMFQSGNGLAAARSGEISRSNLPAPFAAGNVRLLPEPTASDAASSTGTTLPAPALVKIGSPTTPRSTARELEPLAEKPISTCNIDGLLPRAKLRDEAPRSIGTEPRSPAVVRRMPPTTSSGEVYSVSAPTNSSGASHAGFTNDQPPTPAAQASYSPTFGDFARPGSVAPPPWPAADEEAGPRKHIIVDGDTLGKLAERYLHDARRGNEIFELNHGLLASPDLLPIGAELTIPNRSNESAFNWHGSNVAATREAASRGLTPIRPIPQTTRVAPRAQLAPPLSVE